MANLGNFKVYVNKDCKGDKIKLPQSASERLLSIPNISYPLCFELSIPISREAILNAMQNGLSKPERQFIHCGILDFTAAEECVCLPSWIMDNLQISESSVLTVANITLPKGRYVKLQPHTLLTDVKTKQQLESTLRNFTTLTANTTITIPSMNNLKLNVLQVKPNKNNLNSIQIIDCDLVVEFEAAVDGTTNDAARFERNLMLDDTDHKEDIITDSVQKGQYRFYTLKITQTIDSIKIKANPHSTHDIDLYASWSCDEPGVTSTSYDYHCVESGAVELIINLKDKKSKYLYLSVHAFDESTNTELEHKEKEEDIEYTLSAHNISLSGMEIKELYRASSLTQHDEEKQTKTTTATDTETPLNSDPDKAFCANCHRFVNKWSYDRHHAHCIKQFQYCVSCKKVIKLSEIEAHQKTFHKDLKCKMCEETISGGKQTLLSHQKHECLKRPMSCDYCHLPFAFLEYEQHQIICGSRTEICVHCNQYIALSVIQQHCIDVHAVAYEIPSAIGRMKSEDDWDQAQNTKLGGFGAPQRNYEDMNDTEEAAMDPGHERWICAGCEYNNRPNHMQCKICKTKRTKYMKTVSQFDKETKKPLNAKVVDKIGGSALIPQRNYNEMLAKTKDTEAYLPSIKPPLMQYYDQNKTKQVPEEVASGVDPAMIPQRDYDKMLHEEVDVPMQDVVDVNDEDVNDDNEATTNLSTNIDNIPQRDYEQMLKKQDIEYDEALEQQHWVEHFAQEAQMNTDKNTNTNQFRAEAAVIPQRNYDKMMQNRKDEDLDIQMKGSLNDVEPEEIATTSSGYWLCPSSECDHLNKATRNNCSVCHTLKPSYRRTAALLDDSVDELGLEHRWVCKNCDGLNKGSRNKCVYCKEIKSYQPNSKIAARKVIESSKKKKTEHGIFEDVERWVCPNKECNFLNKGSRLKCQVCHFERKDQHILWGDRAKKIPSEESNKAQNVILEKNTNKDNNNANDNKNSKKKVYSHPLEARMMGMDTSEIHNIAPVSVNNQNATDVQSLQWQCPICTFLNTEPQCTMCACPKDGQ